MIRSAEHYVGTELELFGDAVHWKRYWSAAIRPWLGTRVLDVGAGIGATAALFRDHPLERWLELEPDAALAERIVARCARGELASQVAVRTGTLADLRADETFDTALYIDVLEHIEDDAGELARVSRHIEADGHVIVLAPAHGFLYSAFDRAIGHHRRYDRRSLRAICPPGSSLVRIFHLDSAGLLASLANRLLLRQSMPTPAQIRFWDRVLVPCSVLLDRVMFGLVGKSIIAVYRKER